MKFKVRFEEIEIAEPGKQVMSSQAAFDAIKKDFNRLQETFWIIGVNVRNNILIKKEVFKGGMGTCPIDLPTIFRMILVAGCDEFIIAHNHPSGLLEESSEDRAVTRRVQEGAKTLGLKLLDHIIFSDTDYHSMAEGRWFKYD